MFGTEYTGTDTDTSYNLYKDGALLKNVTDSTNYWTRLARPHPVFGQRRVQGDRGTKSADVTPWAKQYTSIR